MFQQQTKNIILVGWAAHTNKVTYDSYSIIYSIMGKFSRTHKYSWIMHIQEKFCKNGIFSIKIKANLFSKSLSPERNRTQNPSLYKAKCKQYQNCFRTLSLVFSVRCFVSDLPKVSAILANLSGWFLQQKDLLVTINLSYSVLACGKMLHIKVYIFLV